MKLFATGQTKTREDIQTRINNSWVKRWNGNDPYSALAVFKQGTDDFLGHVVLGYGDAPGQSEIAYLFMHKHWNKGYGTESVTALVKDYAPATVKEGYFLEGKPLTEITGTTHLENKASIRILEKVGFKKTGEDVKFDAMRNHFSYFLPNMLNSL